MALPAMPPRDGRCGLAQSRHFALMAPGAMADEDWLNSRSTSTLPPPRWPMWAGSNLSWRSVRCLLAMADVGWLKLDS